MDNEKKYNFKFFQNRDCEFFPCHKTEDIENFNCLFCYCPLYALGPKCKGNFRYLESGIKDCSQCLVPHKKDNYGYITSRYLEVMQLAKQDPNKKELFELAFEEENK